MNPTLARIIMGGMWMVALGMFLYMFQIQVNTTLENYQATATQVKAIYNARIQTQAAEDLANGQATIAALTSTPTATTIWADAVATARSAKMTLTPEVKP